MWAQWQPIINSELSPNLGKNPRGWDLKSVAWRNSDFSCDRISGKNPET